MGKGGDWFELSDDKDVKLPRPLVKTMFPPSVDVAQMIRLDKWYTHTTHTHTHTHLYYSIAV